MIKKLRIIVSMLVVVLTLSLVGCKSDDTSDYQLIQKGIETSVNGFKSAKIELTLTSDDALLYNKVINVSKTDTGSNYEVKVKELADDLYSSSLYKESESSGSLSSKETVELFPSAQQFKEDKISNLTKKDSQMEFVVNKENLISVFDLQVQDINRISNEGIKVTIKFENEKVKEYQYQYKTNDNIQVTILGVFTL